MKTNKNQNQNMENSVRVNVNNGWYSYPSCKVAIKELTGENFTEDKAAEVLYEFAKSKVINRFIMPKGKRFDVATKQVVSYETKERVKAERLTDRVLALESEVERLKSLLGEKAAPKLKAPKVEVAEVKTKSKSKAPKLNLPDAKAPKGSAPEVKVSKIKASKTLEDRLSTLLAEFGM